MIQREVDERGVIVKICHYGVSVIKCPAFMTSSFTPVVPANLNNSRGTTASLKQAEGLEDLSTQNRVTKTLFSILLTVDLFKELCAQDPPGPLEQQKPEMSLYMHIFSKGVSWGIIWSNLQTNLKLTNPSFIHILLLL